MPAGIYKSVTTKHKLSTKYRSFGKEGLKHPPKVDLNIALDSTDLRRTVAVFQRMYNNSQSYTFKAVEAALKIVEYETKRIIRSGPIKAYDTGALHNSIRHEIDQFRMALVDGYVFTDIPYAIFVHEGTSRMSARPFFLVALQNKKELIYNIITKAFKKDYERNYF